MTESATVQTAAITSLLAELGKGRHEVEPRLAEVIHAELRRVAAAYMRRERKNHTLQATALVNEAWMRLAAEPDIAWQNRAHFFAVASRLMRQILVDHARRHRAGKRGGGGQQITLDDQFAAKGVNQADILALNEALDRLNEFDPRACRIVEFHFFGGLSFEEMAVALDVSTRTVKRDWSMARAWLRGQLSGQP